MYAVWKYDLFPYKLCGKIIKKRENGYVQVDGFGEMLFKPIKIVNDEKGKKLKAMLFKELKKYRTENADMKEKGNERIEKFIFSN